jgi:biotin operon repressor
MAQQSFKNQEALAQEMASSLYRLADELDYISSNIQSNIELLNAEGVFNEITDTLMDYYQSYYVPNTKRVIVTTIKDNVQYIKKQEEALGHVINERKSSGGLDARNMNDFRFMKSNS